MSELYKLPEGWEWKKLGSIAKLQNGFAFKSKLFTEYGLPIIRIKNIKKEKVIIDDVVYFNPHDYSKDLENYKIKRDDLLIAMSGATTGKIGIYDLDNEAYLNQRVGLFRINNYDTRNYLFYFLSTQIEKNLAQSLGAAQPNLSSQQINDINIPLPPLQEQKRIVAKLDTLFEKIDKAIALHQKNMDEADVFMGSVLNDVFGELEEKYEKQVWNKILKIKNGKHYKEVIDENGKYPIYGSGGIMNYANDYLCNENTVIIGRKGTINNPLFIKEKFWNIDTAFGIEANKDILLPMFLFYFSKHFNFLDLNKSTTLPSLAKTHLLQIMMVLPPLNIQQKTVIYLDSISQKIEKLKSVQKEKMQSLIALKASILDQAFRGEL